MAPRSLVLPALLLAGLAAFAWRGGHAEVSSEARTPAEVYERRATFADALLYVAGDLAVRAAERDDLGPAHLLLVVDPTPSLGDELRVTAGLLERIREEGPPDLRIGVVGAGGTAMAPHEDPAAANGALMRLVLRPTPGPKNLLAAVREGARLLARERGGPRALVLISQEGGEGEDDVEGTRDALLDADAAFYAIAPEAAFERSWLQTFVPREDAASGMTERFHPMPRRRERGALYFGGDVAFGLVPYRWELDLAQTEFIWTRAPRYPVPSGFGYWALATLAYTTGGRYFIHDFAAPATAATGGRAAARRLRYDYGRLALLAPDLRPRQRVLKDLAKDTRARTIVRIWTHLADEARPVIQTLPTLEQRAGALVARPARPVRSSSRPVTWYEDTRAVRKAKAFVQRRLDALAPALSWWESANAKPRSPDALPDALHERIEADFQLLGVQLRKVDFQWREARAALGRIKPLHVSRRRVRLKPVPLAAGLRRLPAAEDLGDPDRNAAFATLWATQARTYERFRQTPWALLLEKGRILGFEIDVQVIDPDPDAARPPAKPGGGGKGEAKPMPKPRPAPPPPGPKPGSTRDGPTTGR